MFTTVAALCGASAVAIGAFGAHGLKQHINDEKLLNAFETGARYHLVHAVALLALNSERHVWAQGFWVAGILLFSGSLYLLPFNRKLGAITPIGGLCFIAGWLALLPKLW